MKNLVFATGKYWQKAKLAGNDGTRKEHEVRRIRKILVTMSVVLAVTAVQVPASADSASEATCTIQEELKKYNWHLPICV